MWSLSIPSPSINKFELGPLTIHIYALCLLTGIFFAWWLAGRRWRARGGTADTFDGIVFTAVVFGILGARVYHVLTHWEDYFAPGRNPWSALYIWEGGIAMFGSLLGGAFGAWLAAKRLKARLPAFADALAPGLIIAQAIGRLGNWFNQELFGGPDDGPLGLEIDLHHRPPGLEDQATFQPTFLYELTWNLAGGVLLLWLDRKFKFGYGKLFTLYMLVYGTGRFWIEGIRTDFSYMLGPLRTNQVTALLVALAGLTLFILLTKFRPGREPEVEVAKVAADKPDAVAASEDEPGGAAASDSAAARRDERPPADDGTSRGA